jgi:glyceraldehyde-3-phosphate dehydrogenase (NADP+)
MGHLQEGKRIHVSASDPAYINRPNIDGGKFFCNGEIREWTGAMQTVYAPIFLEGTEVRRAQLGYPQVFSSIETVFLGFVAREASRHLGCRNETRVRRRQKKCDHPKPKPLCVQDKVEIGRQARLTPTEALEALEAARAAWDNGKGVWPQTPFQGRIAAMEKFVARLKTKRDVIVNVLMWEICKVRADAEKEFDRTIDYINATLKAAKEMRNKESTLSDVSGVLAQVRRNPIGVMLNLGPFNYPFNETYTTLIPSILMGNTVVMKLPNVGCLAHIPTMEVFKECFPKGTVNFISGAGRETMPPIMATGHVDIFAFIGGSKAADALIKNVPNPHKVKFCLSLDAKNLCVVLPDADVDAAVKECVLGALSYNGQRCTALKLLMVHSSILEEFRTKFVAKMGELKLGLPWDQGTDLTPLPEPGKPAYLAELREDAVAKGAQLYSPGEDQGWGHTTVFPSVLCPVTKDMRVWKEEQFGPLVPIGSFNDVSEVIDYACTSPFGQQAAVFTKGDIKTLGPLLDVLTNCVSRVNINTQCQRSPDCFPFTGRKSSAQGSLSVTDALEAFSIQSMVATKRSYADLVQKVCDGKTSSFLTMDFTF